MTVFHFKTLKHQLNHLLQHSIFLVFFFQMGTPTLLFALLFVQLCSAVLGETYRQYRVLTGSNYPQNYYYTPSEQKTYYTNPYVSHPYRYYSNDNNVYVTDMYGRTTVQSGLNYRGFYIVKITVNGLTH